MMSINKQDICGIECCTHNVFNNILDLLNLTLDGFHQIIHKITYLIYYNNFSRWSKLVKPRGHISISYLYGWLPSKYT